MSLMNQYRTHPVDGSLQQASRPSMITLWLRAARLRCPACGRHPIFRGWFTMHEACAACGRPFNRDPGYLLGSIYFNYGASALLVIILYFTFFFQDWLTDTQRLVALSLFAVAFPAWFFRYARAFWIAFDERWDPWSPSKPAAPTQRHVEERD